MLPVGISFSQGHSMAAGLATEFRNVHSFSIFAFIAVRVLNFLAYLMIYIHGLVGHIVSNWRIIVKL
jgi:hypothetical protein